MLELTLRAGDTLYLPRGWLHEALTSETDSLHITVGVNVHTWVGCDPRGIGGVRARRRVPPVRARRTALPEADLLERLAERLVPEAVARRARARFVNSRRPILDGQLEEVRELGSVTVDTPLERRPTVIADLNGRTLSFEGKHVAFPDRVRDELEFVVAADGPFAAADLPGGLNDESRLVLVRRLIREGLLRRSAAGA